ncbi:MAG: hypothetical protein IJS68_04040 [Clostridia bacterium]|nr:hypothetical protein [Clostridia bacterium]
MGNSNQSTRKFNIVKALALTLLLLFSAISFVACGPTGLISEDSATMDAAGNLRLIEPEVTYVYAKTDGEGHEKIASSLSGSFTWNFSYYRQNAKSVYGDEQYMGLTDAQISGLSDADKTKLSADRNKDIAYPDFEVVVDGKPIAFYSTVVLNTDKTINTESSYFFVKSGTTEFRQPLEYIRIEVIESAPGKYMVVFNPRLTGTATTRSIKVRTIAKTNSGRGNSTYSSTITYKSSKLAFSVFAPNSAEDISKVGYLSYDSNAYYFSRIKKTLTLNEADSKITYLEGYFPEGRVVNVQRHQASDDYALASFTANKQATNNAIIKGTLPCTISGYFNYLLPQVSVEENQNAGVFNVSTAKTSVENDGITYNNPELKEEFNVVSRSAKITAENKNDLFYETLILSSITSPNGANPVTTINNQSSTIQVVAQSNTSGYTFYGNFVKVKNFTQSGTVFAGDNFFESNSNTLLSGYTISVYEVKVAQKSPTDTTPVGFSYNADLNGYDLLSTTATASVSTENGQISKKETIGNVTIDINGADFKVTGLAHNMVLVFSKTGDGVEYSFHNATMSNVLFNGVANRCLFVEQKDKTLCGVIGTEYEESSSIEVVVKQKQDGNDQFAQNLSPENISYEIVKSITSKEDIHGYVTTNIILSILIPEDSLLVGYNINTPNIENQIKYVGTDMQIFYNNTTGKYYICELINGNISSGVNTDSTNKNLLYDDKLYTYNFRDSETVGTTTYYRSYYYGNIKENGSFECLIKTNSSDNSNFTYQLLEYNVAEMYYPTNVYGADNGETDTDGLYGYNGVENVDTISSTISLTSDVESYLNGTNPANIINLYHTQSGLIPNTYDQSKIYYFEWDNNFENLTITELSTTEITVSDISVDAKVYKSNLTYKNSQPVYFYYDVMSYVAGGNTTYYYTSPIGYQDSNSINHWFYEFDANASAMTNIQLGSEITDSTFKTLLGEKLVNFYYYYTKSVAPADAQIKQCSSINPDAYTNYTFYKDQELTIPCSETDDVTIVYSNTTAYKYFNIDGKEYRIWFDKDNFSFKLQDAFGNDVDESLLSIGFDFTCDDTDPGTKYKNITQLFKEDGTKIIETADNLVFSKSGVDVSNFKESGTYTSGSISGGTSGGGGTITLIVAYSAYDFEANTTFPVTYTETYTDGEWKGEWKNGSETITNFSNLYIFPTFKITTNENGSPKEYDAFIKVVKNESAYAVVNGATISEIGFRAYTDPSDPSTEVYPKRSPLAGYCIEREAYLLDEDTNEKTQIMVWGKYIPTNDPNDPIIYPSMSNIKDDYADKNSYIFSNNAYYYDIDYSSEKALRQGFMGSYWLSGAPYPNPVLYLSVRHKSHEYSKVEIAVDIKPVYYVEIGGTIVEDSSSNLVQDFSTYSFKDTMANIDANDYINNIYYILNREDFSTIKGYKLIGNEIAQDYYDASRNIDGVILKVNEIALDEESGELRFKDNVDANGNYTNTVYVRISASDLNTYPNAKTIYINGIENKFRPLKADECFIWSTSKKTIKNVGYYDIHGYTTNASTGAIMFNSGELDMFDVCNGLSGIETGTINSTNNLYNFDEVIIGGTTQAYRTSVESASYIDGLDELNKGFFGYTKYASIPIIDSFDAKNSYFLKNRESVMLIADPLITTADGTNYRFLEWKIFSRYNSGVIYYDVDATESLGNTRYSSTLYFNPNSVGYYVIYPIYQRLFTVSVATSVENGPYNQGGSVLFYYNDGLTVKEISDQDVFTVEYLKTLLGGEYGYYYSQITFTPYAYFEDFDEATLANGTLVASNKLKCVLSQNQKYYGVFVVGNTTRIEEIKIKSETEKPRLSNIKNATQNDTLHGGSEKPTVYALTHAGGLTFMLQYTIPASTTQNADRSSNIAVEQNIAFYATCTLSQPTTDATRVKYCLFEENGYLYIVDSVSTNKIDYDTTAPIAKTNVQNINIVSTDKALASLSYGRYYRNTKGSVNYGELAYDDNGNLSTSLKYKTTYIDRGSEIMLVAEPGEGYRFLDWYLSDDLGKTLSQYLNEKYGEDLVSFDDADKILCAVFENGAYYYATCKRIDGELKFTSTGELVPTRLLDKVRGYYINTGSASQPNYVEVFYNQVYDEYFYDSSFTLKVEDKYVYGTNSNGTRAVIVETKTHVSAITSYSETTAGKTTTKFYLNGVQVYEFENATDQTITFYTTKHAGNIVVSGNTLIIKSLHSNIKLVAVYREIYTSNIITDAEDDFDVTILSAYYFAKKDKDSSLSSLANRIDENGNVIKVGDNTTDELIDIYASNGKIDRSQFDLFEDTNLNADIGSLINRKNTNDEFDGYISLDYTYSSNQTGSAWNVFVQNGLGTNELKQVVLEENESLALNNLRFDVDTTLVFVVRTTASNPLSIHTLGLNTNYNLQPLIYPTEKYFELNSSKPKSSNGADVNDIHADYLYYVFALTFNRDPENEYSDLLVHQTREISTTFDIINGYYNDFYGEYFDIGVTLKTTVNGEERQNTQYLNLKKYLVKDSNNPVRFKLTNTSDLATQILDICSGIIDIPEQNLSNITGTQQTFLNLSSLLNYIGSDVIGTNEGNLFISKIRLSETYLSTMLQAYNTTSNSLKLNVINEIEALETAGLIEVTREAGNITALSPVELLPDDVYSVLNYLTAPVSNLVEEKIVCEPYNTRIRTVDGSYTIKTSEAFEDLQDNYYFYRVFAHNNVGNGAINIINLTSIKLYKFSISSLTIDGYDADGNIIYNDEEDGPHRLGSVVGDVNSITFYTSVGTNGRTYVGSVAPQGGAYYYNGTMNQYNTNGTLFNYKYTDTDPDFQENTNAPHYCYADFLLAENTMFLFEGLYEQDVINNRNNYQFMGWYQQKRIHNYEERFYDLDGNRIPVINSKVTNDNNGYSLVKNANGTYSLVENGSPVVVNENNYYQSGTTKQRLYYVNPNTLKLYMVSYNADENVKNVLTLVNANMFEYREWTTLELVSTKIKYPYIAISNADTVIMAIFKKIVDVNVAYNPLTSTLASSTSIDSIGNPLTYTLTKTYEGTTTTLISSTDKQLVYDEFHNNYSTLPTATYEITASGKFYIDATPTFTITPTGGYRLQKTLVAVGENPSNESFENLDEFNADYSINAKYSNSSPLENTNMIYDYSPVVYSIEDDSIVYVLKSDTLYILQDEIVDGKINITYLDGSWKTGYVKIKSTFENTNLTGSVYISFSLNNILHNYKDENAESIININFTTERVTLVYNHLTGFNATKEVAGEKITKAQEYNFEISRGTGENKKTYFSSSIDALYAQNLTDYDGIDACCVFPVFVVNYANANPAFKDHYSQNSGSIEEWLFRFFSIRVFDRYYAYDNVLTLSDTEWATINAAVLADPDYYEALAVFSKTEANTYYFIEFDTVGNMFFYAYFDTDDNLENPLQITTEKIGDESDSFKHWYINAQPYTTSTEDTYPTTHSIEFVSDDNTTNTKYVLNEENLVYFMQGIFEQEFKQTFALSFADHLTLSNDKSKAYDTVFYTLAQLGFGSSEYPDDDIDLANAMPYYLMLTYTGNENARHTSLPTDVDINTTFVSETATLANGLAKTMYHEGRYSTTTNFMVSLGSNFIVFENNLQSRSGDLNFEAGDVYAFIGWFNNGELVSNETSYNIANASGATIEARFVKVVSVDITDMDGNAFLEMSDMQIATEQNLFTFGADNIHYQTINTTVFGYYYDETNPANNHYYALKGANVVFDITPNQNYVVERILYTNPENQSQFIEEKVTMKNKKAVFDVCFMCNSVLKIDVEPGINLKIDQILYNNYQQTSKGKLQTGITLYDLVDANTEDSLKDRSLFAQGTELRLTFNNENYSLIGYFINNVPADSPSCPIIATLSNGGKTIEFTLEQSITLEIRVVENIRLYVEAYAGGTQVINSIQVKNNTTNNVLTSTNEKTPLDSTKTPVVFMAGHEISATLESGYSHSFIGWYYADDETETLLSTNENYIFSINSDNKFLTDDHTITLKAVYATTRTINIVKCKEGTAIPSDSPIFPIFDVIIKYTNKYNKVVSTSLGSTSSQTIEVLSGTSFELTSTIEPDSAEAYYFEGYYVQQGANDFVTSYNEVCSFSTTADYIQTNSATTIKANFTAGIIVTATRRLNDDLYTADKISITANYFPPQLDGKTLSGSTPSIQIGLRTEESLDANLTFTYSIASETAYENIMFVGWYINNKPYTSFDFCQVNENTLTIVSARSNLMALFNGSGNFPRNVSVEARFADVVKVRLERLIDGSNSTDQNLPVAAFATQVELNTLSQIRNIYVNPTAYALNDKSAIEINNIYKHSEIALIAGEYAGYEFIGFKVRFTTVNGTNYEEFIKYDLSGNINNNKLMYYYIDNYNGEMVNEMTIQAYYSAQYTINYVAVIMNPNATAGVDANFSLSTTKFTKYSANTDHADATIDVSLDPSVSANYEFVGYYRTLDEWSSKLATIGRDDNLLSKTQHLTISQSALMADANANNQIFVEARFASKVTITIQCYKKDGTFVKTIETEYPYGVTTEISTGESNFKAWSLPAPDGSNRLVAYYSTATSLSILPLENKTYYALVDSSVTLPTFAVNNMISPKLVVATNTTGLIADNTVYGTTLTDNYINITKSFADQSSEQRFASFNVDIADAYSKGYMFIGWFGSAVYLNNAGEYYFPITSNRYLDLSANLFGNLYAVFAPTSTTQITLNGNIGSYTTNSTILTKKATEYPLYNTTISNGSLTINHPADVVSKATTFASIDDDLYTLEQAEPSVPSITTTRKGYDINVPYYSGNGETRIARIADEDINMYYALNNTIIDVVKLEENALTSDNLNASSPRKPLVSIDNTYTTGRGTVTLYDSQLNEIDNLDSVALFDNIYIVSTPANGYYLDYYIITRKFDTSSALVYRFSDINGDGELELTGEEKLNLRHISIKVLDGPISITPVFKKNFQITVHNQYDVTDDGNYYSKTIYGSDLENATKTLDITAKDGYRISGIMINSTLFPSTLLDYGQSLSSINYNQNTTTASIEGLPGYSHSDSANRFYLTEVKLQISSQENVSVTIFYNKVVTLNVYDSRTLNTGDNGDITMYQLYVDDCTIDTGNNSKTNRPLTQTIISGIKNFASMAETGETFIGYYYNNVVIPDEGIDISGDSAYTIIATYAKQHSLEISIALYDSTESMRINNNNSNTSDYNTPFDGFSVRVTRLKDSDSVSSDVETTTIMKDDGEGLAVYKTANLTYNDNDNIIIEVIDSHGYFSFSGWVLGGKLVQSGETSGNAISPNNLTNGYGNLTAKFKEEVRKITVKQGYISTQDNIEKVRFAAQSTINDEDFVAFEASQNSKSLTLNAGNDGKQRNIIISKAQNKTSGAYYYTISYSIASSINEDSLYLVDSNFNLNPISGKYEYEYEAGSDHYQYKFKSITQINDKVISYGNPYATLNLKNFYQNQTINLNVTTLFNLQYTLSIISAHASDLGDISLRVFVNGTQTNIIQGLSSTSTFAEAMIDIWVEEGSTITIDATRTPSFSTLFNSTTNPIFIKTSSGTAVNFGPEGSEPNITTTQITNFSASEWASRLIADLVYSNIASAFQNEVHGISTYSFTMKSHMYCVADYVPINELQNKYVNAILAVTDNNQLLVIKPNTIDPGTAYPGNTFLFETNMSPTDSAQYVYDSNTTQILDLLDKNNEFIGSDETALSYYKASNSEDYENHYEISSRQTNDQLSGAIDLSQFSENGISAIVEPMANIIAQAGSINAGKTASDTTSYNPNRYDLFYDLNKEYSQEEIAILEEVTISIASQLKDKEYIYEQEKDATEQKIISKDNCPTYVQKYLPIGDTITIKAKVNSNFANEYYIQGLLIINSSSTESIKPFVDGEEIEENNYESYKIVSRDDLTYDVESGTYLYTIPKVSGDINVVVLYEIRPHIIHVSIKELSSASKIEYANSNAPGSTINVDVINDEASNSGKIVSSSTIIVGRNQSAVITAQKSLFSNIIGWATAQTYNTNYLIDAGDSKNIEDVTKMFEDLTKSEEDSDKEKLITLIRDKLYLVDTSENPSRSNLYIQRVDQDMIVSAYVSLLSYTVSMVVEETDIIALRDDNNQIVYNGFVSIAENDTTSYIMTMKDDNFIPTFDNEGNVTNIQEKTGTLLGLSKIKADLISIEESLVNRGTADNPVYYLYYNTGNPVLRYNESTNKVSRVEIKFKEYPATETTTDSFEVAVENRTYTPQEILQGDRAAFYTLTNISLFTSAIPSNLSTYYDATSIGGTQTLSLKPGVAYVSINGKKQQDLSTAVDLNVKVVRINSKGNIIKYSITNQPVDEDGNPFENPEDGVVANYMIQFRVTALNDSGFPVVRITAASPPDNPAYIPYVIDNSEYMENMARMTGTNTKQLSIWDRQTNLDSQTVSISYNNIGNKTEMFTDPNFKLGNLDFKIKFVYAKLSTPIKAIIQTSNHRYDIADKTSAYKTYKTSVLRTVTVNGKVIPLLNNDKQATFENQNLTLAELVQNEVSKYDVCILKNGAYIQNKIFEYLEILADAQTRDGTAMKNAYYLLDFINNFAKTDFFINYASSITSHAIETYQFFTSATASITESLIRATFSYDNSVTASTLSSVLDAMKANYLIPQNFTMADLFTIQRINLFSYYTGTQLDKDAINNYFDNKNPHNLFTGYTYTLNGETFTYDQGSSTKFLDLSVAPNDMCIMVTKLSLKYQHQQNLETNRDGSVKNAIKPYLYYNQASMSFEDEKNIGRFIYTSKNTVEEEITNKLEITTWQKFRNILSAIFNQRHQYDDTYVDNLVSTWAPTASSLNSLESVVSVLTIDPNSRLPVLDLDWEGERPSSEVARTITTIAAAAVVAASIIAVGIATGGSAAPAEASLAVKIFAILKSSSTIVLTGTVVGGTIGLTILLTVDFATEWFYNVNWQHLNKIT